MGFTELALSCVLVVAIVTAEEYLLVLLPPVLSPKIHTAFIIGQLWHQSSVYL